MQSCVPSKKTQNTFAISNADIADKRIKLRLPRDYEPFVIQVSNYTKCNSQTASTLMYKNMSVSQHYRNKIVVWTLTLVLHFKLKILLYDFNFFLSVFLMQFVKIAIQWLIHGAFVQSNLHEKLIPPVQLICIILTINFKCVKLCIFDSHKNLS